MGDAHHSLVSLLGAGACGALCAAAGAAAGWYLATTRFERRRRSSAVRAPDEVCQGFPDLVGSTPLVKLRSLSEATGCTILAKAEFLNPGGSTKDRVARQMVLDALAAGRLRPGGTVFEGTSGSTGISLALMSNACGLRCHIVMPDDQASEKALLLETFGAEVERVRPAAIVHPGHYCNVAARGAAAADNAVFADQFETESNFRAHFLHTGPEIWQQTRGALHAFVMSAGTGGTIAGVSRFLKARDPRVRVVLADPQGSSLFNKVKHGVAYSAEQAEQRVRRHRFDTVAEGIGVDRVTANFARARVDDAVRVRDSEAVAMSRFLLRREGAPPTPAPAPHPAEVTPATAGIFVGSSSAVNCVAAVRVARALGPGHTVVTVLCDGGSRHLTKFWSDSVLREQWGLDPSVPGDLGFLAQPQRRSRRAPWNPK